MSLATKAEQPDLSAFEDLFDSEFSYVCRALRRLGVQEGDLEDLAQDVFLAVYAKFATRDPHRPARPWLFGFAFRFASNYRRSARHRLESKLESEGASALPTPEDHASRRQSQNLLLSALEALPLERRSVLIMHDIDGFTAPDIASALSIPTNTVYSRVRVARAELQKALRRDELRRGAP